ncbi:OmpA family protein [Microlunatus flavus]|uniref:Outer membrane protein OmpA n=1 Tax=Microlunatus flavus TaxID=1036181 RepID=A0A1H9MVD8_9ACTN|nr:OmpA family protein [Microlunatus flavus]SER27385.1 Outer membrane protein OmpA [Microlunatus flavus]
MSRSTNGASSTLQAGAVRRVAGATLVASASLLVVAPVALAMPPGSTAPVVDVNGPVVAIYAGTAEIDGSTTIEPTGNGSKSRLDCTILFGKDSDVLRPGAKERLRRLAEELRSQGAGRVAITGYTDDLGSAAHGLDLSARRARRVAHELAHTLPVQQFPMTVRGLGEAHPAVPNTSEANRRKNRRVVVTLTRTTATRPAANRARRDPSPRPDQAPAPPATSTAAPTPTPTAATTSASTTPAAAPPPPEPTPTTSTTNPSHGLPWRWIGGIGTTLVVGGALLDRLRRRRAVDPEAQKAPAPPPRSDVEDGTSEVDGPPLTSNHDNGTAPEQTSAGTVGEALAAERDPSTVPPSSVDSTTAAACGTGALPTQSKGETESALSSGLAASLAADLAAWRSDDTHRPRLSVLGPVHARTRGKALARRRPYYTELLTYLALHPSGMTVDQIADDFALTSPRVRTDMKILRDWLGADPHTGNAYLPDARTTPAALRRGTAVYQLDGVLCDWHLFTRLQAAAGRTSGAKRADHLHAALNLVTGQPFDQLRPSGWSWLFEGDRIDLHAATAAWSVAVELIAYHRAQRDEDAARRVADMLGTIDPQRARESESMTS